MCIERQPSGGVLWTTPTLALGIKRWVYLSFSAHCPWEARTLTTCLVLFLKQICSQLTGTSSTASLYLTPAEQVRGCWKDEKGRGLCKSRPECAEWQTGPDNTLLCCSWSLSSQMLISPTSPLYGAAGSEQRSSVPGFQNLSLNSPWRTQLYRHRVYGLAFELFHSQAVWRKSALGLHFVQKKRTEEHIKVANRHLTRCSVSSASHLSGRPLLRRQETTGGWQECGGKGIHIHHWWACKLVQPLWQTVWNFLRNTERYLLYNPAIPFPTELKGNENRIPISYQHPVFIATLFTTAKIWKQPKCPSMDE